MRPLYSLLILLTTLICAPVLAEWAKFPTANLDPRILRTQSKAETLYERGDYKRAHFIYSNELARQGDKYAQYMTGYMYLMGQGVAADPATASAWYRIAAERRSPEFLAVRDQLLGTLDDEQRARSDALYVELRNEYSDLAIVMGLLVKDIENLSVVRTGSRLSGKSTAVTIIDPNTGRVVSSEFVRNRNLRAAQIRLDFVTAQLDIDRIKADIADKQLDTLWERVRDYLSVVDDEADGLYAAP